MNMIIRRNLLIALLFTVNFIALSMTGAFATGNERILFLHHSTGGNVYTQGHVADWFADYNTAHGTAYQFYQLNYPNTPYPWANYPYDYWNLWINGACDSNDPDIECLNTLTQNHEVIIYKQCFPGADILPDTGSPDVSSNRKSLENYKLQYRALRNLMDSYPDTVFIVWTLVPLHRMATNPETAVRAKQFVDWVKNDFLTEDAQSHPNIFIFDFWGIAAEDNPNPTNGEVNTFRPPDLKEYAMTPVRKSAANPYREISPLSH